MTTRPDPSAWTCWRDPRHDNIFASEPFGWPVCGVCQASPAYHDRMAYLPEDLTLPVYVPSPDSRARAFVSPRSALVGDPTTSPFDRAKVAVHYEGWVNGPAQYGDRDARGLWEAGAEHAAGRKVTGYPTSAVALLPVAEMVQVGTYTVATRQVVVTDEAALTAWLGES